MKDRDEICRIIRERLHKLPPALACQDVPATRYGDQVCMKLGSLVCEIPWLRIWGATMNGSATFAERLAKGALEAVILAFATKEP